MGLGLVLEIVGDEEALLLGGADSGSCSARAAVGAALREGGAGAAGEPVSSAISATASTSLPCRIIH